MKPDPSLDRACKTPSRLPPELPNTNRLSAWQPGNPFDNAKAESLMKTLKNPQPTKKKNKKKDRRDQRPGPSLTSAMPRRRINGFIADVYNKEAAALRRSRYQSPRAVRNPRSRKTKHGKIMETALSLPIIVSISRGAVQCTNYYE